CREEPAVAAMRGILPRLIDGRLEETVLVFELISDAVSLWDGLEDLIAANRAADVARVLGDALGTIHRTFRPAGPRLDWLPPALPAVMRLHRPEPALLAGPGPGHHQTPRLPPAAGGDRPAPHRPA